MSEITDSTNQNIIIQDVLIFGGGIAGLWCLNRLKNAGYQTMLFESDSLGNGQTILSQGIIHGGLKYSLKGASDSANQVALMTDRWQACLSGKGEIDLSACRVLSDYYYMFSNERLLGSMITNIASHAIKSSSEVLSVADYPDILKNKKFKGSVTRVSETVVDVYDLLNQLKNNYPDFIIKSTGSDIRWLTVSDDYVECEVNCENKGWQKFRAKKIVFAAGAANRSFIKQNNLPTAMQLRPLHMVGMSMPGLKPFYAHSVGFDSVPKFTITSHPDNNNNWIWYLGGKIAEDGNHLSVHEQAKSAYKLLSKHMPWMDFSKAKWQTYRIDRAEPQQPQGKRPDGAYIDTNGPFITVWPTKLTLAPSLASQLLESLNDLAPDMAKSIPIDTSTFSKPMVATPPWNKLQWFKI